MTILRIAARAAAMVAAATLVVSPAMATRTVPITVPLSVKPAPLPAWTPADETAANHRWRRHRGGSTVGNVLTGLLVIGGIAAVAKAIDKDQDKRRRDRTQGRDYPYRDGSYPNEPYDYRDSERDRRDGSLGRGDSREADRAVDACAAEAERSGRVDEILDVERNGAEWRVRGDYDDGRAFSCTVDRDGRAYVGTDWQAGNGSWNRGDKEQDPVARPYDPRDDQDDRYATSDSDDFEDVR